MDKYELYMILSIIAIVVGAVMIVVGYILAVKHKENAWGIIGLLGGVLTGFGGYFLNWSIEKRKKN